MSGTREAVFEKRWGEDCLLIGPVLSFPLVEGHAVGARQLKPFSQRFCLTTKRQVTVAAHVACLLFASSPAHVRRFVVPLDVDAIDGMLAARSFTNISKEVLEGQPALADGDTSRTVVAKIVIVRVSTSREHVRPRLVERRAAPACMPMSQLNSAAMPPPVLNSPTATGFCAPLAQEIAQNEGAFSAFAQTLPDCLSVLSLGSKSDNSEPCEGFSG